MPALDDAARRTASGAQTQDATRQAGYRARSIFHVNLSGYRSADAVVQAVRQRYCSQLTNPALTDVGFHQQGQAWWIIVAAPFTPPEPQAADEVSARVLALVNEARAQARQCGAASYTPAPPLRLNAQLQRAAVAHAQDMARHGMLEHRGSDGSTPADRASRAGYAWRSVGENIASGQPTPQEVVGGWLRSPPHCANIMQPRFTEMGVAYAVNNASEAGIYWAQEFGRR